MKTQHTKTYGTQQKQFQEGRLSQINTFINNRNMHNKQSTIQSKEPEVK
jgi:hypothetical protein